MKGLGEAAGRWRKSRRSQGESSCVEAALLSGPEVGVRHSARPDHPVLTFPPTQWIALVGRARTR